MKKILLLFAFVIFTLGLYAQTPQVFKYQTVVRDAAGGVYANRIVSFRISILRDNPTGTSVYAETHNTTTNDFGIVNLNIGSGSVVLGSFGAIDWGTHEHFVKTEIDMLGGTDFQFMGTSQLLSVPYALFAGKSANAADDFDKDSTNEIQTISEVGNNVTLSNNGGSFIDSDNQTLSKVGDSIKLVNGGGVKDNDNQFLSLVGSQLHISNGNSVTIAGAIDLDWDPTNELQNLSLSGDSLKISMGNGLLLPHDDDADSTNELQTLTKVGDSIKLSKNGGSVFDADNQTLSSIKTGQQVTVSISYGNSTSFDIKDNDADSTNELQTLSTHNDTLKISKGNSVKLPYPIYKYSTQFYNNGNGFDGNFVSHGNDTITGIKYYKNFNLQAAHSLYISGTAIIRVQDTCIISGSIFGDGNGSYSWTPNPLPTAGGIGGGGSSTNCQGSIINIHSFSYTNPGSCNSAGYTIPLFQRNMILQEDIPLISLIGTVGSSNYGNEGHGGAGLYIFCNLFKFNGSISLKGSNATVYSTFSAGGGGGGTCIIAANKILLNTGSINVNGGNGVGTIGYNGGNGWFSIILK